MRIGSFLGVARAVLVCSALALPACINRGAIDLAPKYALAKFEVPAEWSGSSPFVEAHPSDGVIRRQWWKIFGDPVLDALEEQATEANPELEAAAERFVQARDMMMKARAELIPHIGTGAVPRVGRESEARLFRAPNAPLSDQGISLGGLARWEPDFWSEIRNETRSRTYAAQQRAAEYGSARLSLQAELANDYFTLRGIDAQNAIYRQSIDYYERSLEVVTVKFEGYIASALDVARAQYQLVRTQSRQLGLQAEREVVEHAIAVLVNRAPASFSIEPVDTLSVGDFSVPQAIPSTLLQRRPDVAAVERQVAQANRQIGIARAAFFPKLRIGAGGGIEGQFGSLFKAANLFWMVGALIKFSVFEGGSRRADVQQAWSYYREMEDHYRGTLLEAFKEVEDGLSRTQLISEQLDRQKLAVVAAEEQQNLSMELYQGGLASSLDLIVAQVNTLDARIVSAEITAGLLRSTVGLVRALGGGWQRSDLPDDDDIQPFGVLEYKGIKNPKPTGGIDVQVDKREEHRDVSKPSRH
ncbi:MAG: efflux transporter outer membrane subunit [Polyangiales bacterium]